MKNLTLKKIIATLGITALALTSANVATTPANTLAATEKVVTAYADKIKEAHFSIDAANGETFVNCKKLMFTVDRGYICRVSVDNGKTWMGWALNNTITKNTTIKVKCVKKSSNEKTLAKRFAKAKVYTYKFNVINTGVYVDINHTAAETFADGMNVYADGAEITLGYTGKAITANLKNENGVYQDYLAYYKGKGKVIVDWGMKTRKTSTKKYDKKYAKLTAQTLYYTLDGSTPTTKSAKVSAGKLKTIKVTNPGVNTLKVMGAKEKKVYTYTFYVDTATVTATDVPEEKLLVYNSNDAEVFITPQNTTIVGYKYFKTEVGFDLLKSNTMMDDKTITLEPGTSLEVPYDYFEGYKVRCGGVPHAIEVN